MCDVERIYASITKSRVFVENTPSYAFFCAARRWTAIGVGAYRHRPAIDPLTTDSGALAQSPFTLWCLRTHTPQAHPPPVLFCRPPTPLTYPGRVMSRAAHGLVYGYGCGLCDHTSTKVSTRV